MAGRHYMVRIVNLTSTVSKPLSGTGPVSVTLFGLRSSINCLNFTGIWARIGSEREGGNAKTIGCNPFRTKDIELALQGAQKVCCPSLLYVYKRPW